MSSTSCLPLPVAALLDGGSPTVLWVTTDESGPRVLEKVGNGQIRGVHGWRCGLECGRRVCCGELEVHDLTKTDEARPELF